MTETAFLQWQGDACGLGQGGKFFWVSFPYLKNLTSVTSGKPMLI